MAFIIRMPSVLAGATEAAIANWLVAEGDVVAVGQPIAEIETDKAVVEYAAEEAGVLGRVVLEAGKSAAIGDPIAVLLADGEGPAELDAVLPAEGLVATPKGAPTPQSGEKLQRAFASPIARKLATEWGLDLSRIEGTGPAGRITRRDVATANAASSARAQSVSEAQPVSAPDLVPHTGMRRTIARRLTESKATVPHFYLVAECRVDDLLSLRAQVNAGREHRISVNDFVVKAIASAFESVPEANVTWTDEGMIHHRKVDISVAVATDGGLVTPVVRDVGSRSISDVSTTIHQLADRAQSKRLKQDELEGGTFCVSNLGMYGITEFTAILNPPQWGILAVGMAKRQAVVLGEEIVPATVMRCTLSADHRAVDGALAARWLSAFQERMENPLMLLI